MLSVIMLSVIMLSVVMLSVIMLSVVMLSLCWVSWAHDTQWIILIRAISASNFRFKVCFGLLIGPFVDLFFCVPHHKCVSTLLKEIKGGRERRWKLPAAQFYSNIKAQKWKKKTWDETLLECRLIGKCGRLLSPKYCSLDWRRCKNKSNKKFKFIWQSTTTFVLHNLLRYVHFY